MKNNNIVEFPKNKIVRDIPPEMEEEIAKKKEKNRQSYAEAIVQDIASGLFTELENCGVDSSEENFQKDFIFLAEAMKALVYRNMGLKHPVQSLIDDHIKVRIVDKDISMENIEKVVNEMLAEFGVKEIKLGEDNNKTDENPDKE